MNLITAEHLTHSFTERKLFDYGRPYQIIKRKSNEAAAAARRIYHER